MSEQETRAEYVKSHIEHDLRVNKSISGKDYSAQLGGMLYAYLTHADDEKAMTIRAVITLGALEDFLRRETGALATFHETKKCGWVVHKMWKEHDVAGFTELQKYAEHLMRG